MKVVLTHITEDPVSAIEEAACNCYDSTPTGGKIMKACYASGHHSVLEFADFTFHIEGISRACSHQLVRHRMASFAQRSQRYCNEVDFSYVVPCTIGKDETAKSKFFDIMNKIQNCYEELQQIGIPNEDARYILPNACSTVIEAKMNGRELIHFMNERLCNRAQWEIKELCQAMKKEVEKVSPEFASLLVPKCEKYGKGREFCPERQSCGRHKAFAELIDKK